MPQLLAAVNSSGGVLGKMISPRNLTIACASDGRAGREGHLLRKVLPWGLGLLLVMCLIVLKQSTIVLGRMLPRGLSRRPPDDRAAKPAFRHGGQNRAAVQPQDLTARPIGRRVVWAVRRNLRRTGPWLLICRRS